MYLFRSLGIYLFRPGGPPPLSGGLPGTSSGGSPGTASGLPPLGSLSFDESSVAVSAVSPVTSISPADEFSGVGLAGGAAVWLGTKGAAVELGTLVGFPLPAGILTAGVSEAGNGVGGILVGVGCGADGAGLPGFEITCMG